MSRLTVRISTILGILIWEFQKNDSGGYPLKSFTAEFRKYIDDNNTDTVEWERLDPINIAPNVVSLNFRLSFSFFFNSLKYFIEIYRDIWKSIIYVQIQHMSFVYGAIII